MLAFLSFMIVLLDFALGFVFACMLFVYLLKKAHAKTAEIIDDYEDDDVDASFKKGLISGRLEILEEIIKPLKK